MAPVLPGGTIGILGGGQLGRMTALAARSMGYHIHALDPDPACAARAVVDRCVTAPFGDADAAADLASRCDVVTVEIEQIPPASLLAAARHAPTRPDAEVLGVVQDRGRQKEWLAAHGFPVGPYRVAGTAAEADAAAHALGGPAYVKSCGGGYDGRSQIRIDAREDAAPAWGALGRQRVVVERALPIAVELSVLVARAPGGATAVYPPALNHHEERILAWSVIPGPFPPAVVARAQQLARAVAEALAVVGLLAVELFLLEGDELLINELAPRPHNSYHASELACVTSQFEQHARATCGLPLGATDVVRPAAIVNLLGDVWLAPTPPAFEAALAVPGVRLVLYGKSGARPGRKMGHLAARGATAQEAVSRVLLAKRRLTGAPDPSEEAPQSGITPLPARELVRAAR